MAFLERTRRPSIRIQNDAAAQKFGIVSALGEYDTDSDNDTFAAGVQDLQKNSLMVTSYTVKAVDLRDAGYDKDRLTFASYAHIISKPHSIDVIMLCTKLVEPLDQPDKKEYTFGMTRQTLTDRQVANLGRTNLLDEDTASAEKYQQSTLNQLFKYQKSNDKRVDEVDKKAGEAAKTATNFLEFTPENGLIVRHDQLPNKKVQITNDGIKVLSGSSMVSIKSDSISITDGNGSCTIDSGKITFYGIRNARIWDFGDNSSFGAQTIPLDLADFSAVYLTYTSKKGSTWWASGGTAGCVTMVIPVNGVEYAMTYPWNTTHMRTVRVNSGGITFGPGRERTSNYVTGNNYTPAVVPTNFSIDLESPGSDGWTQNDSLCMPRELYGFM